MVKGRLPVLGQPEARPARADAQHNRARILEAAKKMVKKRGLDGLCMDELAALAGVGKGTLYRRFADKTALLHALLDEDERELQEEVRREFARYAADLPMLLEKLHAFVVEHAPVLAAAEASARGDARYTCAPYAWRHALIAQLLERTGPGGAAAEHLADVLLSSMSGELVLRALQTQSAAELKAQARAFFLSVCKNGAA